jgi:uncharacterized protein
VKPSPPGQPAALPAFEYPLDYTFKIMGAAAEDFAEHARRLVARQAGQAAAVVVQVRSSAGGKYQSVAVSVRLESEEQRRAVYRALHEDPRVLVSL